MSVYQGYTLDTTDAEAIAAFIGKFGVPPREVKRTGGCILVGPILLLGEGETPPDTEEIKTIPEGAQTAKKNPLPDPVVKSRFVAEEDE